MARAHDLLAAAGWPDGVDLRALLEAELAPYLHAADPEGPQAEIDGPPVRLAPAAALALALAVHELVINAARHGALSMPTGRVRVRWNCGALGGGSPRLRLEWREAGGPPVPAAPARHGFGSRLLARALPAQLDGRVALDFAADGLRVSIEAALPRQGGPVYAPPPAKDGADAAGKIDPR